MHTGRTAIAHGSHAGIGVAVIVRASHNLNSLFRRIDILPESPTSSMFPSGRIAGPHAGNN
jgi:hypothetical protein